VLNSVSCTAAGDCSAGGSYWPGGTDAGGAVPALDAFVLTEQKGAWGKAIEVPGTAALNLGGSAEVSWVSCWSPGDCTAAGQYAPGGVAQQGIVATQAFVATEHDGVWGRATELRGLAALNTGKQAFVNSISCTAGGNCAVGGEYTTVPGLAQAFVADELAGRWQPAEEVPGTAAVNVEGAAGVSSVSCASPGNCAAAGYYAGPSARGAFVASETKGTWLPADAIPDGAFATSVSCPSAGNCVAGGALTSQAFVITEQHGTWGGPQPLPGLDQLNVGQSAEVDSVSCTAPGDCGAGGTYAGSSTDEDQAVVQAFVVTETDGRWADAEQVPGISALTMGDDASVNSVSCVGARSCTATGTYGSDNDDVFVVSTQALTATAESLSTATVTYGHEQAERVSVAVTAAAGEVPAGSVTVKAGFAVICVITLRSGRGSCRLPAHKLAPGTYDLTAAYPGSPDFASSVSRAKTLTVMKSLRPVTLSDDRLISLTSHQTAEMTV
jgi:hypothetical protein